MKVGYIQNNPEFGNKKNNLIEVLELSKSIKADLIVLPELFATGYTFVSKEEAVALSEEADGMTFDFLSALSQKTDAVIVAGFVEKDKDKIYNSSIIVYQKKLIGVYRKLHLFYKENLWFSPGNLPLKVYNVKDCNIGIMICFDWFFPEVARTLALQNCDVLAHPANLVLPYCQQSMMTRCIENKIFAVTANRIGNEIRGNDNFNFTGASQITSQIGEILSSAAIDKPHVDVVDIDINLARDKKINSFNHLLSDRRSNFYNL